MKSVFRAIGFGSVVGISVVGSTVLHFFGIDDHQRLLRRMRFMSACSKLVLRILGIDVEVSDTQFSSNSSVTSLRTSEEMGRLIVANHVSYLDALVLLAKFPARFITSIEVKNTAVLGFISRVAGCIFVERRRRTSASDDIRVIADSLSSGFDVVLFPEGTSTDGKEILPFKTSLFEPCIRTGAKVLPIRIHYHSRSGLSLSGAAADKLYYYGEMTFWKQLWKLFGTERVVAKLQICALGFPRDFSGRKDLCRDSYEKVLGASRLAVSIIDL